MKITFMCEECEHSCFLNPGREYEEENPMEDAPTGCPFGLITQTDDLPFTTKATWSVENAECDACDGSGTIWYSEDSGFHHHGGGRAYIDAEKPCSECDGTGYTE